MPGPGEFRTRSTTLRRVRAEEFAHWFGTRKWRVVTERTETREIEGVTVYYERGEFWIDAPNVKYKTPLGGKGQHGFVLQEVGADGSDIPGSVTSWGLGAVRKAHEVHNAIVGEVPPPTRRRRHGHPQPR